MLTVVLISTMVLWSQFLALGSAGGVPATCVPATCGASRSRKTCLCPGTGALGYPATCVEQKDWVLKKNSLEAGRRGTRGRDLLRGFRGPDHVFKAEAGSLRRLSFGPEGGK